jgi:hypothetical protein
LFFKPVEFDVANILPSKATRLAVFTVAAVTLMPTIANANPVILNPSSLLAFCVVAFWAMVVEAGIVALLLAFRGAAVLPVFGGYFLLNGAVFLFLFQPLLVGSRSLPVPVLEGLVVLVDAAAIKLLVALNPFQGDGYRGVSWFRSVVASGIGNALSYVVGYIATRKPWEIGMDF